MLSTKAERLASLFLVVFSTLLSLVLAGDGMRPIQWLGAAVAILGSMSLATAVRLWPRAAPAAERIRPWN